MFVDYIPVHHKKVIDQNNKSAFNSSQDGMTTYVPTDLEFTITLMPQYSPRRIRRKFDLDGMRQGKNIGFI